VANSDIVILGSGYRGLWLATEIVKLGWSASWFQIHQPIPAIKKDNFVFDDWPWQVGPNISKSHFVNMAREFIDDVLKPKEQEIAIQVITPNGPLELSGPAQEASLKKFFPKSYKEILSYFETIKQSQRVDKGQKILSNHTSKFFQRPLGERWCLELLGGLRRSRAMSTQEWVKNWEGDLLDPASHFWLLNDPIETVVERALQWAEEKGVSIKRNAVISDIGVEGRRATGIEIQGGEGFLSCKQIVLACSYDAAIKSVPRFAKHIQPQVKNDSEVYVWSRCGFYLKPGTKPSGLAEFSSFVMDPYMPLVGSNVGLLKWRVGDSTSKGDSLTVWCRVPFAELRRRSYLMNLTEELEKHLGSLFPWFSKRLVAVFPFEEYFHSPGAIRDDLAIVYNDTNKFKASGSRLKNVTQMGPGADRGLELLSQLATEYRMLNQLSEIRKKELKRDRALHPPRNGENMVQPK
jgi:hypothetical protein